MKPQVIAFYLPQYHPIPENDIWWGNGFTEWTNVGKAKPLFPNHYQPRIPADLGYYDLRVPETREAQAFMAREAGIDGFCYWHYWFGNGKRLLERPFNEMLATGKPNFPFCLAWANESWKDKSWNKDGKDIILMQQEYLGITDYTDHFFTLLPAFKDRRYFRVNDKPLFVIYKPLADVEITIFIKTWRCLAKENGLNDFFFVGHCFNDSRNIKLYQSLDLDAINTVRIRGFYLYRNKILKFIYEFYRTIFHRPYVISFKKAYKYFFDKNLDAQEGIFPTIITGWDNTPRGGWNGTVMKDFSPYLFGKQLKTILEYTKNKKNNIIFLKSWNEWAEGNYIEPDLKWGMEFLNVLSKILIEDI